MKDFGLHFRYRDERNELFDVGIVAQASSQKDAKQIGRNLERPAEKVWFNGLIPVTEAQGIGGRLP